MTDSASCTIRKALWQVDMGEPVLSIRTGRSIIYNLYDNHVAQLLDEAVYHSEHLRLGLAERPASSAG